MKVKTKQYFKYVINSYKHINFFVGAENMLKTTQIYIIQ